VAMQAFIASDAIVDKMAGDAVIALYVPGLTGADFRQRAVTAGLKLLHATGHGDPDGPWLPIGVGVHAGEAFMGSIGVEGGNYQFTALGDAMNYAARLVASAKSGEMVMSETIWRTVSKDMVAEACNLELKGYVDVQRAYVARLPAVTR